MKQKKHNEETVLHALKAKHDIDISGKNIQVLKQQSDLGNGSWGKIDFLTNYCGYKQTFVNKFF